MKKVMAILLSALTLLGFSVSSYADGSDACAVIGADLTEDQIESVYGMFGVSRGSVTELTVTNAEERTYLSGLVDDSIIGTRSISCVYVELLKEGRGMDITVSNISWCSPEMYMSALATAGITDAKIVVAAPFEVSGTAALTGVYKAYEALTGEELDDLAKIVSTQELTVTGELAEEIGNMESTEIVNELKLILDETKNMTDAELRAEIVAIATEYGVRLDDSEIDQLVSLCRSLEKLNTGELKERVEEVQSTLRKLQDAQTKVTGFVDKAKSVISAISEFFAKIKSFFSK